MEVKTKSNILSSTQVQTVTNKKSQGIATNVSLNGCNGGRDDLSFGYYPIEYALPQAPKVPKVGGKLAATLLAGMFFPPLLIAIPLILLRHPKHVTTKSIAGVRRGIGEVQKVAQKLKPKHVPQGMPMEMPPPPIFGGGGFELVE